MDGTGARAIPEDNKRESSDFAGRNQLAFLSLSPEGGRAFQVTPVLPGGGPFVPQAAGPALTRRNGTINGRAVREESRKDNAH